MQKQPIPPARSHKQKIVSCIFFAYCFNVVQRNEAVSSELKWSPIEIQASVRNKPTQFVSHFNCLADSDA